MDLYCGSELRLDSSNPLLQQVPPGYGCSGPGTGRRLGIAAGEEVSQKTIFSVNRYTPSGPHAFAIVLDNVVKAVSSEVTVRVKKASISKKKK